jgi:hypothetical protein
MDTVASEIDGENEAAPQPKDSLQPACTCNPPAILRPAAISRAAAPAKAGVHSSESAAPEGWAAAFVGVANTVGGPAILPNSGASDLQSACNFASLRRLPRCRPGDSRGPFVRKHVAGGVGSGFPRGGE